MIGLGEWMCLCSRHLDAYTTPSGSPYFNLTLIFCSKSINTHLLKVFFIFVTLVAHCYVKHIYHLPQRYIVLRLNYVTARLGQLVQNMASKIVAHACLILKRAKTCLVATQAALMIDSGRFNLQANTDKIQHLL